MELSGHVGLREELYILATQAITAEAFFTAMKCSQDRSDKVLQKFVQICGAVPQKKDHANGHKCILLLIEELPR